ncbi:alpha-E domain-containing protein [Insolitispirillum peregrinum]|uniref:Uncharacterized conserved protein, Alpha-E superfamily n=1 Tax=Insolitispirillum peregrinum TaxID=80876 RepID=A0A1N7Q3F7_9PROT|nr:alpha-E domain-containing protein [Insolitispirillum peregrinum]SIT17229.1 Uncharacterized conserved protein, Alpha-E superfamily [Insolitispirillum peregrinum]
MTALLSRNADNLFWLARYVERVENMARILDVTESFSRDTHNRGRGSNWMSVVQINADEEAFTALHPVADGPRVVDFYMLDASNSTSIPASLQAARENARTLRALISVELWQQINMFNAWVGNLRHEDVALPKLSRLCQQIREACQAHTGIVEGTFFRDQAWYFYSMGRVLERADQTTRLLDIKYHTLLPRVEDVGSALDVSQWNALLRAAAGYHGFRRISAGKVTPEAVVGFLLFNDSHPRSVSLCIRQLEWYVTQVRTRYGLKGCSAALEALDELRAMFDEVTAAEVLERGLHEFVDCVQQQLVRITSELTASYMSVGQPAA